MNDRDYWKTKPNGHSLEILVRQASVKMGQNKKMYKNIYIFYI